MKNLFGLLAVILFLSCVCDRDRDIISSIDRDVTPSYQLKIEAYPASIEAVVQVELSKKDSTSLSKRGKLEIWRDDSLLFQDSSLSVSTIPVVEVTILDSGLTPAWNYTYWAKYRYRGGEIATESLAVTTLSR